MNRLEVLRRYGALSIQPQIPEISVWNQMERTISVLSDQNIWDHLWRRSILTDPTGCICEYRTRDFPVLLMHPFSTIKARWLYNDLMNESAISLVIFLLIWLLHLTRIKRPMIWVRSVNTELYHSIWARGVSEISNHIYWEIFWHTFRAERREPIRGALLFHTSEWILRQNSPPFWIYKAIFKERKRGFTRKKMMNSS